MLHVDDLEGTPNFKSYGYLIARAKKDIETLQNGGINGILIENWKEDSIGEFVTKETENSLTKVVLAIIQYIKVPFGINVLNNDYKVALSLAKATGANFIQLDVFVDHVLSNFTHSPNASKNPFEINLNPEDVTAHAKKIDAENIPIFVFVQPKHYKMLEKNKPIELSVKQAIKAGASAILITKETGTAPTIDLIKRAKSAAGDIPVGIGSGFSAKNAEEYLKVADFATVGTSIKMDNNTDNPVDIYKVKKLMDTVHIIQEA